MAVALETHLWHKDVREYAGALEKTVQALRGKGPYEAIDMPGAVAWAWEKASLGLEKGAGTKLSPILAAFKVALHQGELSLSLGQLGEAAWVSGAVASLEEAAAHLHASWRAGALRLYGAGETQLLGGLSSSWYCCRASPVHTTLCWPLLSGILRAFQRERLRPAAGLIIEICISAFRLHVCIFDLLVAVAAGPPEACSIVAPPWPEHSAAGVLFLLRGEATDVVPPYEESAALASEHLYFGSCAGAADVIASLQDTRRAAVLAGDELTLGMLFTLADARRRLNATQLPVGRLMWAWEKANALAQKSVEATLSEQQEMQQPGVGCHVPYQNGTLSTVSVLPDMPHAYLKTISTLESLGSLPRFVHAGGDSDDAGADAAFSEIEELSEASSLEEDDYQVDALQKQAYQDTVTATRCAEGDSDDEDRAELSVVERFLLCFRDDLRSGRRLFLNQLNNIYKVRANGRELNGSRQRRGTQRTLKLLASIPSLEVYGSGKKMAVRTNDPDVVLGLATQAARSVRSRRAELQARGVDVRGLKTTFKKQMELPQGLLRELEVIFCDAPPEGIAAADVLASYKVLFCTRLRGDHLGYPNMHALLSQVPFAEKIGHRRCCRYAYKPLVRTENPMLPGLIGA